jgi:three-Cys-motif partner protein
MKAQRFGSAHTEKKLQLVARYLDRFMTALKNQPFQKLYVDAFAGTGAWTQRKSDGEQLGFFDLDTVAEGSALRALRVVPPFDRYIFIERSQRKSSALQRLSEEFPNLRDRIEVVIRDANDALAELCKTVNWRNTRAVVFLDPFGFEVKWETVEALARTHAVDLWYLVPTGIGINRQITKDGRILPEGGVLIDSMLGTDEWRRRLVKTETTPTDLFGESEIRSVKAGGIDEIADLVLERLATIFKGGVVKYGLPLGTGGRAMYTLVFACANPAPKASQLALRLAGAVLKT